MPGHGPQQRPLDPAERSLLHRVIGWIADDPRWQLEPLTPPPISP
jgi:hypothetical protein